MVYYKTMVLLYIYSVYTMMLPFQVSWLLQSVKAYDSASVETCRSCIGFALDTAFNACIWNTTQSATFYFDSVNVLWWIQGYGLSFHPLVANLIGEIQIVTEPLQWHHVPTGKNPADLCTRGTALDKLLESHSGGMDQSGYCQRVRLVGLR